MSKWVIILAVVVLLGIIGSLMGSNKDQDSCNNIAGNGKYSPVEENGITYCENFLNGHRFYLHD